MSTVTELLPTPVIVYSTSPSRPLTRVIESLFNVPFTATKVTGRSITLVLTPSLVNKLILTVATSPTSRPLEYIVKLRYKYDSTSTFVYPKSLGVESFVVSLFPHQLFFNCVWVAEALYMKTELMPSNMMESSIIKSPAYL